MQIRSDDQKPVQQVTATDPQDDGVLILGSPPPVGTGRTDVDLGNEAGVDELPDDGGALDSQEHERLSDQLPDIDPDNAEADDAPNPR